MRRRNIIAIICMMQFDQHLVYIHEVHSSSRSFLSVFQSMDFQGLVIIKSVTAVPAQPLIVPSSVPSHFSRYPLSAPLALSPLSAHFALHTQLCTPLLSSLSCRAPDFSLLERYCEHFPCPFFEVRNLPLFDYILLVFWGLFIFFYASLVCILEFL